MSEEQVTCSVCGAENKPGAKFCSECGIKLAVAARIAGEAPVEADAGVDQLLKELLEKADTQEPEPTDATIDDLLDSLVVAEEISCPLCGAELDPSIKVCPECGTEFVEKPPKAPAEEEIFAIDLERELEKLATIMDEAAVKPAPEVPVEPPPARAAEPEITSEVSEDELPKVHIFGSRYIDFVVLGDVTAIVAVFLALGMYQYSNLALWKVGLLFSIAAAGVLVTWLLFKVSTSLVAEGDRLLRDGRFEDALARYNRAIRFESSPADAWTSKGVALKRLGRYDDALLAHNMALRLQPRNEVALCNKGDLLVRMGKYEDALKCYERAIEIKPKYAVAWNNKAIALLRLGRLDEAKEVEDVATKLRPSYAAAWINKGRILVMLGRTEEAKLCYQRGRALALP